MITVGIDLGTTNSCVAFHDGQSLFVIPLPDGSRVLPSVVSYLDDGEILVGELARDQIKRNTQYTFSNVKRLIGKPWRDNADQGPQTCEGDLGKVALRGRDGPILPEQISALVLRKLRDAAEEYLRETVEGAIVTVPAYFDENQKAATIEAARMAGFTEIEVLGEPMAAALACDLPEEKYSTILVFDMGGGTFDVAVMHRVEGQYEPIETNGEKELGGLDFDRSLTDFLVQKYKADKDIDLRARDIAMLRLAKASEEAKRELTERNSTVVSETFIADNVQNLPEHLSYTVTREEFDNLVQDHVRRALKATATCLTDADRKVTEIDHIVLVGGMTRMPLVRDSVRAFFGGKAPLKTVNPDEIVALGAAIKAAKKDNRLARFGHTDIVAMAYGIETAGGSFLPIIPKGAKFGTAASVIIGPEQDGQGELAVGVFQGRALQAAGNTFLAEYRYPLTAAEAGMPVLRIDCEISETGLLTVTATDAESDQAVTIIEGGKWP